MHFSTTGRIAGRTINKTLAVITADSYVSFAVYKSGAEPQPQLLAPGFNSFDAAMASRRQAVLVALTEKCEALTGDAVVGLSFRYSPVGEAITLISGTGTAVQLG